MKKKINKIICLICECLNYKNNILSCNTCKKKICYECNAKIAQCAFCRCSSLGLKNKLNIYYNDVNNVVNNYDYDYDYDHYRSVIDEITLTRINNDVLNYIDGLEAEYEEHIIMSEQIFKESKNNIINNFYCSSCDIILKKNSRYNHIKTKKHLINT